MFNEFVKCFSEDFTTIYSREWPTKSPAFFRRFSWNLLRWSSRILIRNYTKDFFFRIAAGNLSKKCCNISSINSSWDPWRIIPQNFWDILLELICECLKKFYQGFLWGFPQRSSLTIFCSFQILTTHLVLSKAMKREL